MSSSPSFYHKVNDGITINLAEVGWAENREAHYRDYLENEFCKRLIDTGRVCVVETRSYKGVLGHKEGGIRFDLTVEEFRILQDALDWYNRAFARGDECAATERMVIRQTSSAWFDAQLKVALGSGWRVTPGTFQAVQVEAGKADGMIAAKVEYFVALER